MIVRTKRLLMEYQNLTLEQKIDHSYGTIEQFLNKVSNPVILFSGGKDSTVLLHFIRKVMKIDIPAIFINTGNEYPEIIKFVKTFDNVTIIRPKHTIKKIIEKYGFPLISKEYSKMLYECKKGTKQSSRYLTGLRSDGQPSKFILPKKYRHIIESPFYCSDKCCNFLKKNIAKNINSITATMASESTLRSFSWIRTGCNNFGKVSTSNPFSIWKESDIFEYKRYFGIKFCDVYEDPRITRTGCMFCGFGTNFEHLSRFEYLMENYPKLYNYFLNLQNNGISYETALNTVGVILPHQSHYQRNIFSK